MSQTLLEHPLLRRVEHSYPLPSLMDERVLVTGAAGSIGRALTEQLSDAAALVVATDIDECDVLDQTQVERAFRMAQPTLVFHLAADKHAPRGESEPERVSAVSIDGTKNVVEAAKRAGVQRLVSASTCKAAVPETVYGASKLIAERVTLNAGYTVARLYNTIESSGNVFELWAARTDGTLPVTDCTRYFISIREAASFVAWCVDQPPGRYSPDAGMPVSMREMAKRWCTENGPRLVVEAAARRGDRRVEPLCAPHEARAHVADGAWRITNPHDK